MVTHTLYTLREVIILIDANNKMSFENLKDFSKKLFSGKQSTKIKIFSTISILWMILIGYLVWWNGLKSPGFDKSFKWEEWIWFGLVPAVTPFIIYIIWKKDE
mgnify:CR=1 FL=1